MDNSPDILVTIIPLVEVLEKLGPLIILVDQSPDLLERALVDAGLKE